MTQTPLVSVVTPFHNTAAYLRECIESVLAQSHQHLEFILQDNASTDGSTDIANEFARRDARIKYFRVDELISQVPNYNLALSRISPASEYCKIVQADDWISADCLRDMVALAERSLRIGLVSGYRLRGDRLAGDGLPYGQRDMPGREASRLHLLTSTFLFGSPTTVMYRSEVVRQKQPFFADGRLHEDTEACYEILRDWDFGFVHQVLSFSRMNDDSISSQTRDKDSGILDKLIVLRRYGQEFLASGELRTRVGEVERKYYRQLARAALFGREPEYWRYHKQALLTQGPGFEVRKFIRALGRELLSVVACPRQILEILGTRARRPAR